MNTYIPTAVLRSQTNSSDNKMALIRKIRTGVNGPVYKSNLRTRSQVRASIHSLNWYNRLLNKIKAAIPSGNQPAAVRMPEYGASNYLADDFYEIFGLNITDNSTILSKGSGKLTRLKKKNRQIIPLFI